jgi:tetratricopeptide (TPR) repeat protein
MCENMKDPPQDRILDIKESLAYCYLISGDSKRANDLYKQINSSSRQPFGSDSWHEAVWRGHFALTCYNLNDDANAEKFFLQAMKGFKQSRCHDRREIQADQFWLAKLYARENRNDEAELYLNESIENAFRVDVKPAIADTAVFASMFYRKNKINLSAAEAILTRALHCFGEADKFEKRAVYRALSNCALEQGDTARSKAYTRSAELLNKDLKNNLAHK